MFCFSAKGEGGPGLRHGSGFEGIVYCPMCYWVFLRLFRPIQVFFSLEMPSEVERRKHMQNCAKRKTCPVFAYKTLVWLKDRPKSTCQPMKVCNKWVCLEVSLSKFFFLWLLLAFWIALGARLGAKMGIKLRPVLTISVFFSPQHRHLQDQLGYLTSTFSFRIF